MNKEIEYYMGLDYPIECYGGEHEIGDAFLAIYTDFDIKASSEDVDEAKMLAKEYLRAHIERQLQANKPIPKPHEGVRFMQHREALKAYRAKDFETALKIWLEEAKHKNDQAMANLGLMYLKGEGVEKNYDEAKAWFEKASTYDNDSAHYNLGLMYQSAIGVAEDKQKATHYLRQAGTKNHQNALFRLGLLLLQDRTIEENLVEGFDAMLRSAKLGHPMAMAQMGGMEQNINLNAEKNHAFRMKSKEAQMGAINDAINRFIRPILVKDGGDIRVLEYISEPEIEIRLAYLGACAGCSLGATSTFGLIRNTLAQVIDEAIAVYVI